MVSRQHSTNSNRTAFWQDPDKRAIVYQVISLGIVLMVGYYLFSNTMANLERQNIATGFKFLDKESAFEIGESMINYSAADTYGRALLVGVLNTLKVSFIGIIITVILGTIIGIARLSSNWLVSRIAALYIEVLQDIPVLLQTIKKSWKMERKTQCVSQSVRLKIWWQQEKRKRSNKPKKLLKISLKKTIHNTKS